MPEANVTRKLAAIFYADVAGYSRLTGKDEEGTHRTVSAYLDAITTLIEGRGGRVLHYAGDAILAEFASVVVAVTCAIDVQRDLADRNKDLPDDRKVQFRIGVNLGDVIVDRGEIYGDGVNIAARLESLSDPGGICISQKVFDEVQGKVDVGFEAMGPQQMKNIAAPVQTYRIILANPVAITMSPHLPIKPSIAVMPFANLSGDLEQEYFADGMTEDIITELSRFEDLFVISSNSSFTYKGKRNDIKKVARELGVRFILEGSVRKRGNQLRISAQLVNGHDGNHIWVERYDGNLEDVFDMQEEVTSQVVGSILPAVTQTELERIGQGEAVFDGAFDLAWRANSMRRSAMRQRDPSMVDQALSMAAKAVELNDKCSVAYQVLCLGYAMKNLFRWGENPDLASAVAEKWAQQYFAHQPNSYMAYHCLALASHRKGAFQEANRYFRRAHELNHNDSTVLRWWAWCEASAGEFDGAQEHAQMAIRLSPKDSSVHVAYLAIATSMFITKDPAFEEWANRAIEAAPYAPMRRALMIAYAAETGDTALLETHRQELMRNSPDFIASIFRGENRLYEKPEHMAKLLDGLRRAGFSEQSV